jgi:hypothetical protein
MPQLESKVGLIVGVANKRSIAWAIAQAASDQGAMLVLTFGLLPIPVGAEHPAVTQLQQMRRESPQGRFLRL